MIKQSEFDNIYIKFNLLCNKTSLSDTDMLFISYSLDPILICCRVKINRCSILYNARIMNKVECYRCGFQMIEIQPCHLLCPNCGAELDCSDKGFVW